MTPGGHGCDSYKRVRLLYRKISDPNSNNNTKDVELISNPRNWTDILNVYDGDRYEITLIVFNNEGLSSATMKYTLGIAQGKIIAEHKKVTTHHVITCLIL